MYQTPRVVTLLDLVTELSTQAGEREVVAAVMHLLEMKQVTLIGQIRGEDLRATRPVEPR